MNCGKIRDIVYEQEKMSFLTRALVGLHLLFCPDCAREIERFETCRDIMLSDFPPASPGLEDAVMAMIAAEEAETPESEVPGGFSTRGWVIAGVAMLVSLATAFFGLDFNKVALAAGISFMIPIGITIGIALTSYGALFIGSHLKELSERFGL
ncbi:MAG: peptidoglycan-binding protein [Treponema sp.]|nr:peptidoglycan-binding protein [Treponema sp.]